MCTMIYFRSVKKKKKKKKTSLIVELISVLFYYNRFLSRIDIQKAKAKYLTK